MHIERQFEKFGMTHVLPIIVFKGVPALVCDQCGESYADEDVTDKLLQIVAEETQKGSRENFIQYVA